MLLTQLLLRKKQIVFWHENNFKAYNIYDPTSTLYIDLQMKHLSMAVILHTQCLHFLKRRRTHYVGYIMQVASLESLAMDVLRSVLAFSQTSNHVMPRQELARVKVAGLVTLVASILTNVAVLRYMAVLLVQFVPTP